MATNTIVSALGMHAENQHRLSLGHSIAYNENAFQELIEHNGCNHNDVIKLFET